MTLALGRGASRPLRWAASTTALSNIAVTSLALRPCLASRRYIQTSERRTNTIAMPDPMHSNHGSRAPLSVLPLSTILRSLATTTVSSSPTLLPPSLRIMAVLAHTQNAILNPDRNPILRFFLKKTFYAQFCAGETPDEVKSTIQGLKQIGFTGVILNYAKEVVLTDEQAKSLTDSSIETDECIKNEILPWAQSTLDTVRLASPGDFVALK